jgi:Family of unknown function (DUF6262)
VTDRIDRLRHAARTRHDTTLARATQALHALTRDGQPITFGRLARAANVSRSWIYRQPELRHQIEQLRPSPATHKPTTRPAQRATADSLRQQLHTYRQEIARLQAENRALKNDLARQLGATRAASIIKRS